MPKPAVARLALVLLAVIGLACASRDPVEVLLEDLVEAAEDRDADALGALLAEDFSTGEGADRTSALQYARQMLMAYESLDIELADVQINRRGDTARATFRGRLVGTPTSFGGLGDLVPRKSVWDFDVTARNAGGDWRLVSASWKDAAAE